MFCFHFFAGLVESLVVLCVAERSIKFMAEKRKKYGLYDKDGNFLCYRMTKRIKNEKGEYDVLTAKSKKSVTDC